RRDLDDLGPELASAPARQEVEQAMVVPGNQDPDALLTAPIGESPVHPERLRDRARERGLELVAPVVDAVEVELEAHEERPAGGVGRVLRRVDDVRALLEEERRNRGDDAGAISTGDDQAGGRHGWGAVSLIA